MWRPWPKSTVLIHNTTSSPSSSSSSFSCSTFKDIETLSIDDRPQPSSSRSGRRAAIFHRFRAVKSLLRSQSNFHPQPPKIPRSLSHPTHKPDDPPAKPNPNPNNPNRDLPTPPLTPTPTTTQVIIPGADQRIIVYFTSLRVVRPTFDDCKSVLSILRGYRVTLDERDVSMDVGFMSELRDILGPRRKLTLPRVFIDGRYIGGADEVMELNETGELRKIVERLPAADYGVCDVCGGYRFILCQECNGSRKIHTEEIGFNTCMVCNENGLIRCPSCYSAPL